MTDRISGTRAARRVEVKFPPPGTSPERRKRIADAHREMRATMAKAAHDLVEDGVKPTVEAVVAKVVDEGGTLSVPTANRKADALKAARDRWERKHGRQPEWHRRRRARGAGAPTPVEGGEAAGDGEGPPLGDDGETEQRLRLAEERLKRLRNEFEKAARSRDRLSGENAELREQVRRLELALTLGG